MRKNIFFILMLLTGFVALPCTLQNICYASELKFGIDLNYGCCIRTPTTKHHLEEWKQQVWQMPSHVEMKEQTLCYCDQAEQPTTTKEQPTSWQQTTTSFARVLEPYSEHLVNNLGVFFHDKQNARQAMLCFEELQERIATNRVPEEETKKIIQHNLACTGLEERRLTAFEPLSKKFYRAKYNLAVCLATNKENQEDLKSGSKGRRVHLLMTDVVVEAEAFGDSTALRRGRYGLAYCALSGLGVAGGYADAIHRFEDLHDEAKDPSVQNCLGVAYFKVQDIKKAFEYFSLAKANEDDAAKENLLEIDKYFPGLFPRIAE